MISAVKDPSVDLAVGTRIFHSARGPGSVKDIDHTDERQKPYGYLLEPSRIF